MTTEQVLLDPTAEREPVQRQRRPRPTSLSGLTVGVLDISKPRGDVFLDRLAERFTAEGITVKRYRKPTVIRPAPLEVQQAVASECDIVVEGLAD
tara:strand:+ start:246 stop:530 length:285 start_codon:yes stop_codon:yes gene_type:complete